MPYVLVDPDGVVVEPVRAFFADLLAAGRSAATLRSYGNDLLRWFRFLWTVEVPWDRATRVEARDFCRWLQGPVKFRSGGGFSASVRAHSETVLRTFYDLHRDAGTGPIVNPFPLARARRDARAHAHHNPMDGFAGQRVGLYRPVVPQRVPRSIPDEVFNELFAALPSHRDRALVALYVSTGARASELLGVVHGDVEVGRQLITVVRKGDRRRQQLPASPDAFVWLRLYLQQMKGLAQVGRREPLWWTLRRPVRPLTYHGAHRMFERVNALLGTDHTLHSLRHTAAYRMARDPQMPLTDVQWVLGHADLRVTQRYTLPHQDDVIRSALAHHERQAQRQTLPPVPAPEYNPDSLNILFGHP